MSRRTHLPLAVVAGALMLTTPAYAAAPPLSAPKVLVHLDRALGQQPENIALEPDGSADVTFAYTGQVARVDGAGRVRIVAQVPVPADGDVPNNHHKIFLGGIVRAPSGALYVAVSTGTAGGTGVYLVRSGRTPVRVAALPADSFLNGMAADHLGRLYIADSAKGLVWRVPPHGRPAEWATGDALAPRDGFGANGVKVHDAAVWVSNIGAGTLLRIPIGGNGAAGPVATIARGLGPIDDFAFTGRGRTVLAAINQESRVVLIRPDGTARTVLTAADGLSNPTSVAVRARTVYVTDGAYFTEDEPNLVTAHLAAGRPRGADG